MVASIPAPGHGRDSGLAWAEGSLWVGQYLDRKIHQIDPETGAVTRTIETKRFVTGVTWVDGELWHGTWEGDESDIRRINPESGAVLERLEMPRGTGVSGLESDGQTSFIAAADRAERSAPCGVRKELNHNHTPLGRQENGRPTAWLRHRHKHWLFRVRKGSINEQTANKQQSTNGWSRGRDAVAGSAKERKT